MGQLHDIGVTRVGFSGGEPLLRVDLEPVLRYATALGMRCSLTTNALCLSAERAASLSEAGLATLVVSLDSVDSKTYRMLRGRPLAPVLRAIAAARRWFPDSEDLAISAVVTRPALDGLPDLASWCAQRGLPLSLQPLHGVWGAAGEPDEGAWLRIRPDDEARMLEVLTAVARSRAGANGHDYIRALAEFSLDRHRITRTTCKVGSTSIVVHWDLCVSPCWGLPRVEWDDSGSLLDLVSSEEYLELVRRAGRMECPGCWLACHHDQRGRS